MKSKVVLHGNPYFLQDSHYTAMTMAIETNIALAVDDHHCRIFVLRH